jgi:hypothetical protein
MPDTPKIKTPKSPSEAIETNLKRARKLAGDSYDENQTRVAFMLEESLILAKLEVAAALRGE